MTTSHTGAALLTALATLTLGCLAPSICAFPLPPGALPSPEQELGPLTPQSSSQGNSNEDVVHDPRDPPPPPLSDVYEEALQDVLRDDQEITENEEYSPERNPLLQDRSEIKHSEDDSPVENSQKLSDDGFPFENVVEDADEYPQEGEVESPLPVLKETNLNEEGDEEGELQDLNTVNGDDQENLQGLSPITEYDQGGQRLESPIHEAQESYLQDLILLNESRQEEQKQDSSLQNRDSQEEEELQSLQADSEEKEEEEEEDEEEEEEEEEEENKLKHPSLPEIKNQNENEAASQELDSMAEPDRKESDRADDLYNDYDSDEDDEDDDDDDDDAGNWRKVSEDEDLEESYPEESLHADRYSSFVKSQYSVLPGSVWSSLEDDGEGAPRYSFDDVMAAEELGGEVGHEEEKRGEGMEEEEEEEDARFRPVRVIVLKEPLYLNTTEDDHLPKFQPVPMPDRFEDYDVNKDRMISLPELRYVSRATEGARQAFRDADSDGDGWVDRDEFQRAGWGMPVDHAAPPSLPPLPQ